MMWWFAGLTGSGWAAIVVCGLLMWVVVVFAVKALTGDTAIVGRSEARRALDRRVAAGEISMQEYHRLRTLLKEAR